MLITDFIDEYSRYRIQAEKAIAQIDDDALNRVPVAEGNSIAMIMRHVGGNLTSRFTDFLTADGEKPWRDRDKEFVDGPFARADVQDVWAKGFSIVAEQLSPLSDDDLSRSVTIRGVELSVHEALCRSLAHVAMHVGQIILLAKLYAGPDWETLSIGRNKSAEYNQNPTLERASAFVASQARHT